MLFFLISCFSFLLLSQSFLKPRPCLKTESRMWPFPLFSRNVFPPFSFSFYRKRGVFEKNFKLPRFFPSVKTMLSSEFEEIEEQKHGISLLDLPDLTLDCILEKLSPDGLYSMSAVCISLRQKCTSDHFWEKHMNQKWNGVIGDAAKREWQSYISSRRVPKFCRNKEERPEIFSNVLGLFWDYKSEEKNKKIGLRSSLPSNSVMYRYLALESGKFWFPAQVFNREVQKGHVGFMLSCYDAHLNYDSRTDNFIARYPAQGRRILEEDIEWNRIRAPSVDTHADVLHISDCLEELRPDDHIEIQWRRNKEFPYGWWYGVVGHLDCCNGNEFTCQCHISDTIILEFRQYAPESQWRKAVISRKHHREVGNEADGFYGGIRKLYKKEEVAKWQKLWPNCTLE